MQQQKWRNNSLQKVLISRIYFNKYRSCPVEGDGWTVSRLCRFTSTKEKRYPLNRKMDGPRGRSGCVRKILPPPGSESPDCPARSESLYRLRYPGRQFNTFWSSTKKILQFLADDVNKFKFLARSQNCQKRLPSSCPSVRLQETTRLPLDGLWWNLILEYFSQNVSRNLSSIKIWQE